MGRRVFLSVLGVAFYETCRYRKDDFTGSETLFVQKSLLEYLQQQENWGGENDLVLMLLTDLARKNNWDKNLETRFCAKLQKEVAYQGLEKILLDMNLSYQDIAIPDGKDSEQMWEIFEVIFDELQEGDELYLDITNSFRYLPMLLVVLVNYAKLLKNVKVKDYFLMANSDQILVRDHLPLQQGLRPSVITIPVLLLRAYETIFHYNKD